MKNRIILTLFILIFFICFTSCVKCVNTEYKDVSVVVVDEYCRGLWMQPIIINGHTTYINHPAVWEITVEYNGIRYTINDHDTYNKYKNKIGEVVLGRLEIKTYDNGDIKYEVVSLD